MDNPLYTQHRGRDNVNKDEGAGLDGNVNEDKGAGLNGNMIKDQGAGLDGNVTEDEPAGPDGNKTKDEPDGDVNKDEPEVKHRYEEGFKQVQHIQVVIDGPTRYPEAAVVKGTSADNNIRTSAKIFSRPRTSGDFELDQDDFQLYQGGIKTEIMATGGNETDTRTGRIPVLCTTRLLQTHGELRQDV